MSLEAALEANTKALLALVAKFDHIGGAVSGPAVKHRSAEEQARVAKDVGEPGKPNAVPSPAGKLEYERDVKPHLVKVASSKGQDALKAVLSGLGVAKGGDIKPEQYAAAIEAAKAAL